MKDFHCLLVENIYVLKDITQTIYIECLLTDARCCCTGWLSNDAARACQSHRKGSCRPRIERREDEDVTDTCLERESDLKLPSSAIRRDEIGAEVRTIDLIGVQVTVGAHAAHTATAVVACDGDVQLEHLIEERARTSWSCERGAVCCKRA